MAPAFARQSARSRIAPEQSNTYAGFPSGPVCWVLETAHPASKMAATGRSKTLIVSSRLNTFIPLQDHQKGPIKAQFVSSGFAKVTAPRGNNPVNWVIELTVTLTYELGLIVRQSARGCHRVHETGGNVRFWRKADIPDRLKLRSGLIRAWTRRCAAIYRSEHELLSVQTAKMISTALRRRP